MGAEKGKKREKEKLTEIENIRNIKTYHWYKITSKEKKKDLNRHSHFFVMSDKLTASLLKIAVFPTNCSPSNERHDESSW